MPSRLHYRTDRRHLAYIKKLLEGYDNLAVMTAEKGEGRFVLLCPDGMEREVTALMEGIRGEVEDLAREDS